MKKIIYAVAVLCFLASGASAMNYVQFGYAAKARFNILQLSGNTSRPRADRPTGGATHIYSSDEIKNINAMMEQNEKTFKYISQELYAVTYAMESPLDNAALEQNSARLRALVPMLKLYTYNDKLRQEYYFQKFPVEGPDYNNIVRGSISLLNKQLSFLNDKINQQLQSNVAAAVRQDSIPAAKSDSVPAAQSDSIAK